MSGSDRPPSEEKVRLLIGEALDVHEERIRTYLDERFEELEKVFSSGFPGGDPHGHRLAHEEAIRHAGDRRKLKAEVTTKVFTGGIWAAIVWLVVSGWNNFLDVIGRR
jgi:hypothetical protein